MGGAAPVRRQFHRVGVVALYFRRLSATGLTANVLAVPAAVPVGSVARMAVAGGSGRVLLDPRRSTAWHARV
ncbi:MAG: hypothetical protein QM757_23890 [Paludibaculum sp.]